MRIARYTLARRSNCALAATMTVLADISTALVAEHRDVVTGVPIVRCVSF